MQLISNKITYLVGSEDIIFCLSDIPVLTPFADHVIDFLNDLSNVLIKQLEYSDIVTFAFWIRQANINKLRERFYSHKEGFYLGRGLVFHIAPSNVPVNFAYSLVSSLLMGNSNVIRVPSKDFPQVKIITSAISTVIEKHKKIKNYIVCVRYDHDKEINDLFSSLCDVRIVWGGNSTIAELRKSPLPPRSYEITFADRYSLAVIDADAYLAIEDKARIARDFYNDTFFSDQNACTSPRIIIWTGEQIAEAKKQFWKAEHELVKEKYKFQPIMAVNKLARLCVNAATSQEQITIEPHDDNLIIRVAVSDLAALKNGSLDNNSGFFYEYDVSKVHLTKKLKEICNNKRCQTICYLGNRNMFTDLLNSGVRGIDRIVPMGQTMDFDLIWDGYNLSEHLSRVISI